MYRMTVDLLTQSSENGLFYVYVMGNFPNMTLRERVGFWEGEASMRFTKELGRAATYASRKAAYAQVLKLLDDLSGMDVEIGVCELYISRVEEVE
jgi:hypothetical protein